MKNMYIDIADVKELSVGDWINHNESFSTDKSERAEKPQSNTKCTSVKIKGFGGTSSKILDVEYLSSLDYVCHNRDCKTTRGLFHCFEITEEYVIMICEACYDKGYRFCLFSYDVAHASELEPVFDSMYVRPDFNQGQLSIQNLSKIGRLVDYFKEIGISNPNPVHYTAKISTC